MNNNVSIISPIDGHIVAERNLASVNEIDAALQAAVQAQQDWRNTLITDRATFCHKAIDNMLDNTDEIAREITLQMGRPIQYSPGELRGLEERGRYMIDIAEQELADRHIGIDGTQRFIRHTPLGLVLTIAPWNYPYLTAVNSIIPALMAGNVVILKHSVQTLLCAERFQQAFAQAGLPQGVFQSLPLDHPATASLLKHPAVDFISFTGSVSGGMAIEQSAAGLFKGLALELGGKDPAYVREDADLDHTVANLVMVPFLIPVSPVAALNASMSITGTMTGLLNSSSNTLNSTNSVIRLSLTPASVPWSTVTRRNGCAHKSSRPVQRAPPPVLMRLFFLLQTATPPTLHHRC